MPKLIITSSNAPVTGFTDRSTPSPIVQATKQLTLAANDFTTMALASSLLSILGREAPSVDLVINSVTRITASAEKNDFQISFIWRHFLQSIYLPCFLKTHM
ncbi:hypothetical protein [Bradyrhizobium sp. WSM3983]|uniref:hypothetical protein n=1 Tax=Bradyrhizobium sp. WSM3983 TaxID=1038867 RepID=UPI00042257D3|nr:hypothetical protein [Bradyrhizobium sp. WSM3983]